MIAVYFLILSLRERSQWLIIPLPPLFPFFPLSPFFAGKEPSNDSQIPGNSWPCQVEGWEELTGISLTDWLTDWHAKAAVSPHRLAFHWLSCVGKQDPRTDTPRGHNYTAMLTSPSLPQFILPTRSHLISAFLIQLLIGLRRQKLLIPPPSYLREGQLWYTKIRWLTLSTLSWQSIMFDFGSLNDLPYETISWLALPRDR